ncbi:unnamed protein product [Staurois parvus]|uniref:Uncharacterized protein n=1 Tax=Staurois parvus TaxID=386267 RepID=A0ABN9CJ97_9NEOB|nr:unnamed protein product [Staurois parvus]
MDERGDPCCFLFTMVLVFKFNSPFFFFFFTIAQKFTCHFPQLKEKVFLEFISLKETMFTLSLLKDTKFSVTSGK